MIKELPKLAYDLDSLEPYIDAVTMEIHYTKHHKTYLDKLLTAVTGTSLESMELEEILASPNMVDESIRTAVINNGGGVYNHNLFWKIIGPAAGTTPNGTLLEEINKSFGSFENFKEEFTKNALSLFGSGWTWLVLDKENEAKILNLPLQKTPLEDGYKPLLALDLWEHAYYLKYQNRRADYVANWWNVVNWDKVSEQLQ